MQTLLAIFFMLSAIVQTASQPPLIVGEDRVPVRQSSAVLIYDAHKAYRNDRVFAAGFQ
jgi:hypothetical protein